MSKFKLGDIVYLKAQPSPQMVVEHIDNYNQVECVWFSKEKNEVKRKTFIPETLMTQEEYDKIITEQTDDFFQ